MKRTPVLLAVALAAAGVVLGGAHDAQAIIGRPLTPFSYAGVARRTVRRSVRWGAYGAAAYGAYGAYGAYAPPVYAAPPVVVQTVPAAGYAPAFSGPTVIYVNH